MKKKFMTVLIFISVSLFSTIAYAADSKPEFKVDTKTHINLVGFDRFAVNLEQNKLVFENEPLSKKYDSITIDVRNDATYELVHTITCERGKCNGVTVDLNGLTDGMYVVQLTYIGFIASGSEDGGTHIFFTVKDGKPSFVSYYGIDRPAINDGEYEEKHMTMPEHYANALKAANERTDAYALDVYKYSTCKDPVIVKKAQEITSGITDDYEKVRLIQEWVSKNMTYTKVRPANLTGLDEYLYGVCFAYANLTEWLCQAVGIPSKEVFGLANGLWAGWDYHVWNEVYVDGRWVFVDSTFEQFDLPMAVWSGDHFRGSSSIIEQDSMAWDGSLTFYDAHNTNKVLKVVKNFPLNGLLTDTYGFDAKYLYTFYDYYNPSKNTRWDLAKDRVNVTSSKIYVDTCEGKATNRVNFWAVDTKGFAIDPEKSGWQLVVPVGSKLTKPANPVLKGYTFAGWYNVGYSGHNKGKKWDFEKDTVAAGVDYAFESHWVKGETKPKPVKVRK